MFDAAYERELLRRAAEWAGQRQLADLSEPALRAIASHEGNDFATALLYDRFSRSPRHGPFIRKMQSFDDGVPRMNGMAKLVVVPGGFYKEFPGSGADGRVLREVAAEAGLKSEVVPLGSFGSLRKNAAVLCDWLSNQPDEPVILASLSKAGAEVKLALSDAGAVETFKNVRWWLNLSGPLDGSALARWLLDRRLRTIGVRLLCRLRGYDFAAIDELLYEPGSLLDFPLHLPAHMRAIHVVGFPLARTVTRGPMRRGYRRLRELGPTDGAGILLASIQRWPGDIYPLWGADHYLRPPGVNCREIAGRLLRFIAEEKLETIDASGDRRDALADSRFAAVTFPERTIL